MWIIVKPVVVVVLPAVAACFKAADFVLGEAREKSSRRRIFIRRGQLFEQQRSIRRKQRFKGGL
jgi:hypothetical protein